MWPTAWNTLWNFSIAATVVMTIRGALCALLGLPALECLVTNLLAVITLHRSWPIFKDAGCPGLPSNVEVSVGQEPPRVGASSEVHDHRAIWLRGFLAAKPRHLGDRSFVFFTQCYGCTSQNGTVVIQHRSPLDAVDLDRVELVPEHPGSCSDLFFRHFLDQLVLGFITTRNPDPIGVSWTHGDRAAAPVGVIIHRPDLFLDCGPD
ncbi:hypothetical protein N7463_010247 [Penicillium fimorum]|uniref:Uncharacterized protein n=1 Tax=Penicillium fimorum TaxID=1882269 RepID=A0A9W9XK85_9EURO|nr:hypothetical protein N7463_010247 [Penicillium fimorum]